MKEETREERLKRLARERMHRHRSRRRSQGLPANKARPGTPERSEPMELSLSDVGEPDYAINARSLVLGGFFVYVWRRGPCWLYVGSSKQVIRRLYLHETVGKKEGFAPEDEILLYECDSEWRMRQIEESLIYWFNPKHNIVGQARNEERETTTYTRRDSGTSRTDPLSII